jgi:hypothetical protein
MAKTTGYSGTPLAQKLGYKAGMRVLAVRAPADYRKWLAPLPRGVAFCGASAKRLDLIHLFAARQADLARRLPSYLDRIVPHGAIWLSWPKKGSGVATDISEDVLRAIALPLGLVDIKVCAVNATWSALKFVIRRANRPG